MKYLFILGRNIELSKQEVLSYFGMRENPVLNYSISKNGMLVELDEMIDPKIIDGFGGVLAIGQILASGTFQGLKEKLKTEMIYTGEENKLNYVLWDFSENHSLFQDYLRQRFKEEKLKATEKHLTDSIDMQDGTIMDIPSSKLLDEEYFIFQEKEIEYFGRLLIKCDYQSLEKRDMEKPVRRESLAIAPRLAKIMINLAQLKEGDTMLDPFCGIGVVLEEALVQGIKVIGVDVDRDAINGARQNMEWFNFSKENYQLIKSDSTKVDLPQISGIATEPDLGEVLKKIPTKNKAEDILTDFERLMIQVINNLKEKVSGRMVFTSPLIRIGKKRLSCNIEHICEKTNYKEVFPGIEEYRGKQVVGRKIFVLEKVN